MICLVIVYSATSSNRIASSEGIVVDANIGSVLEGRSRGLIDDTISALSEVTGENHEESVQGLSVIQPRYEPSPTRKLFRSVSLEQAFTLFVYILTLTQGTDLRHRPLVG
jgi:hypothetical protein